MGIVQYVGAANPHSEEVTVQGYQNFLINCTPGEILTLPDAVCSYLVGVEPNWWSPANGWTPPAAGPQTGYVAWVYSTYTLLAANGVVIADPTSGGSFAVTLTDATAPGGDKVTFKHPGTANTVTLTPVAGQTIDGAATLVLAADESVTLYSDGTVKWRVLSTGTSASQPKTVVSGSKLDALATNWAKCSPMITPVYSGTFTPNGTYALVDVDIGASLLGLMGASVTFYMYYGDNAVVPAGQLTPTQQANALGTGITRVDLARVQALGGYGGGHLLLTGLTAGHEYRYEISAGGPGYFDQVAVAGAPICIGISGLSSTPEYSFYVVTGNNDGSVSVIQSRGRSFSYGDKLLGSVSGALGTATRCAVTPDGTKAVVTYFSAGKARVILTGASSTLGQAVGVPSEQASSPYSLPAGDTPAGVAITPDGTKAWMCLFNNGTILPMTIATGAFGTASNVLVSSGSNPFRIAIDSAGHYAYVTLNTSQQVVKVDLTASPASVVATSASLSGLADFVALDPSGNYVWVVTKTSPYVYKLNTSDLSNRSGDGSPWVCPTNNVAGIAMMPDGAALMIASTDSGGTSTIYQFSTAYGSFYTSWALPSTNAAHDIAVSAQGDIWVPDETGDVVDCWPGAMASIYPGNTGSPPAGGPAVGTFTIGQYLRVRFQGAST